MSISRLSDRQTVNPYFYATVSSTSGSVVTGNFSSNGIIYDLWSWGTSGTVIFSVSGFIDLLLIGPGGNGAYGGGGGGGQIRRVNKLYVNAGTTYTVLVGGAGSLPGSSFSNAIYGSQTALGGGNAVYISSTSAAGFYMSGPGACGAGLGAFINGNISMGGGRSVIGSADGGGVSVSGTTSYGQGAGGGGASGAIPASASINGTTAGTNGSTDDITGTTLTYCGGGGGGNSTLFSAGGTGGGGSGGAMSAGTGGLVNSGGGGGGNWAGGKNGGSGIIRIRIQR